VSGYLDQVDAAKRENRPEQIFMNVVLYRLLYAQAMAEGAPMGLAELGEILADPGLPAVDVLVHLPDFYPRHYPLTQEDIKHIMDEGHSLEEDAAKFLDDVLILPHLSKLYHPLIDVNGLPCWPSTPRFEQIVEGKALKDKGINLEAFCSDWEDIEEKPLVRGEDFDDVILGISLGALPYVACDLVKASDKWKAMVDNVQTVQTQAFQLWLKPTAYGLGWTEMARPILSPYNYEDSDPLATWADMSHLIPREAWPAHDYPLNIAYFCGALLEESPPPHTDCGPRKDCERMDQKAANDHVKAKAIDFLNRRIGPLWPNAVKAKGGSDQTEFNWELLADDRPGEHQGEARFDSQYWRANISPPELYVLTVPGSSKHRLPAVDPHEFTNLYLAGDWTDNGLNLGCVESAAMSGLLASLALSGYPRREEIITLDL
jgi:uncharacterized protein with NAD-binding domain and iron-sulfur cluster